MDEQREMVAMPSELTRFCDLIVREVRAAERKFPLWPEDEIHAVAVMAEEAGEAVQAALQHRYEGGEIGRIDIELVQTAAMCFRAWLGNRRD